MTIYGCAARRSKDDKPGRSEATVTLAPIGSVNPRRKTLARILRTQLAGRPALRSNRSGAARLAAPVRAAYAAARRHIAVAHRVR